MMMNWKKYFLYFILQVDFRSEELSNLPQNNLQSSVNANNRNNTKNGSTSKSDSRSSDEIIMINGPLIPPEPEGICDPAIEEKIKKDIAEYENYPITFTENFKRKKQFKNPNLLEQIINYYNINEYGSNFSTVYLY